MRRRTLLRAALISVGLLGLPRQAFALGGTLPELDQLAPPFDQGTVRFEGFDQSKHTTDIFNRRFAQAFE